MSSLISTSILVANLVFAATVLFFERKRPMEALAWLLLFTFVPVGGFVLYMFFGQKFFKQKKFRLKKEDDQRLARIIEAQHHYLDEMQAEGLVESDLAGSLGMIHLNLTQANAPLTFENEVTIFNDGQAKFDQLFRDIEAAKESIHVEYFIWRSTGVAKRLIDALTEKAKAGVEVRVILDDWGCKLTPKRLFKPLEQAGGEVHRFLPITLAWSFNANYRLHRKIVVIDGEIGYTGGMNVGDEYLGLRQRHSPWRDTHLRLEGAAVAHLQTRFLLDWAYVSGQTLELGTRYLPDRVVAGANCPVQIVSSGPDSEEPHVKQGYLKLINLAKERLLIQTPYLVPDESILEALKLAAFSGVDVRVMIPKVADNPMVYQVTMAYVGDLLRAGIRVFKREGFLHSKAIVADGRMLSIGTANLDMRSFALNFEVNAFIYDQAKAAEYEAVFAADLAVSEEITLAKYNQRPLWRKFVEGLFRLLAPLL